MNVTVVCANVNWPYFYLDDWAALALPLAANSRLCCETQLISVQETREKVFSLVYLAVFTASYRWCESIISRCCLFIIIQSFQITEEFYCEELPPNRWKRLFPIVLRGGGVFTVASLTATQAEHVIS